MAVSLYVDSLYMEVLTRYERTAVPGFIWEEMNDELEFFLFL